MSAALFDRPIAFYLGDYADLLASAGGPDCADQVTELRMLHQRARDLNSEWESKVAIPASTSAAAIVAGMLSEWKLPGAVWYLARRHRFRLVGDTYQPERGEICVGVYLPTATTAMLEEDFSCAMEER